jgi:pimeloyl-ACP methyl ester carboxylesterase
MKRVVKDLGYEAFSKDEKPAFEYDDKKSSEIAAAWSNGKSSEAMELLRQLWCSALTGSSLELFMDMVKMNAEEVFNDRSFKQLESRPPAYKRISSIRVPTTVLVGDRDNPSSVPFAKLAARGIAGARLVTVKGADHLINMSRPKDFETELRLALDRAK